MSYSIVFHIEAKKELDSFDNSVKLIILKQIKKLEIQPELGKFLGNKDGMDLTGYRKLYALQKKIRIIYRIIEDRIEIQIISINKRDKLLAYKNAFERI
ncbi:MAG TPA: addiction module toxin RelE [Candidatus Kapabacteria bacterium]|nr:addiction module toxin RelE [Candidatus Kapabacteria bacterium]